MRRSHLTHAGTNAMLIAVQFYCCELRSRPVADNLNSSYVLLPFLSGTGLATSSISLDCPLSAHPFTLSSLHACSCRCMCYCVMHACLLPACDGGVLMACGLGAGVSNFLYSSWVCSAFLHACLLACWGGCSRILISGRYLMSVSHGAAR